MAELLLDRLALQKLHVVDDQHVDGAQALLEGDRRLRLQRRDEAVHELLGGEIDDTAALVGRLVGDRLDQMRLPQPYRGVDVERIVEQRLTRRAFRETQRGGMGELVRATDEKRRKGHAPIERRAGEAVGLGRGLGGGRRGRAHRVKRNSGLGEVPLRPRHRTFHGRCLGPHGTRRDGRARCRTAHGNRRRRHAGNLGAEHRDDPVRIMRGDPALEELGRHRETGDAPRDILELEAAKPRIENVLADLGPQPTTRLPPSLAVLTAGHFLRRPTPGSQSEIVRNGGEFDGLEHLSVFSVERHRRGSVEAA